MILLIPPQLDHAHAGNVSCVDFQEVLHSQEHYCSLAESRRLFNSLADPSEGKGIVI
jgi:hypothetical protein